MLSSSRVAAVVAVKDLAGARSFYEGTLGLSAVEVNEEAVLYACGSGTFLLAYPSSYAGTNEATAATWDVEDIRAEVGALKEKGVSFEHYDLPGGSLDGDVHVFEGLSAAWFKDPDGNILSLTERG